MDATAGPWMVAQPAHDPNAYDVTTQAGGIIAKLPWCRKADAQLLAAAPDLLAACEAALNDRMFKEWPEVATLLKNAIAKARGEQ